MRRILSFLLLLAIITGGAFAQELTWINPFDPLNSLLPESMIAAVSSGQAYDEFDAVVRSPAELSDYDGYSVFTGYGNYESWDTVPTGGSPGPLINPFTTGAIGTGTVQSYLYGYTFPFMGFRTGLVGGFELSNVNNIAGGLAELEESTTDIADGAGTIGTSDYTETESYTYTDFTNTTNKTVAAGVDLDVIGASLYANISTSKRRFGGTYSYQLAAGESTLDTVGDDVVSAKSVSFGLADDGAARAFPVGGNTWTIGLLGQLPFELMGASAPITGSVMLSSPTTAGPAYNPPKTVSITEVDANGAGIDETNTLTYTVGDGETTGDELGTGGAVPQGEADAAFAGGGDLAAPAYALDSENYRASAFMVGFEGQIDPIFELADGVRAKSRAKLGYSLTLNNTDQAGTYTFNFSEANAAADNSTYTETSTIIDPQSVSTNAIDLELGGILEFTDGERLTLGTGMFYAPTFSFATTTEEDEVTTTTTSWTDTTNTDGQAAGLTAIGPGVAQGTRTDTQTTTYDAASQTNTATHQFLLPVTAQLDVVPDTLTMVAGYVLDHSVSKTTTTTGGSTTTTVTTVSDTAGNQVFPAAGATTTAAATTQSTTQVVKANSAWQGQANWMLRWMPIESMTVDLWGSSIMTVLDFDLFGDNGGGKDFNLSNLLGNLAMSVTFHF